MVLYQQLNTRRDFIQSVVIRAETMEHKVSKQNHTWTGPGPRRLRTQPIRSPVQDEVHVERTIAGGVVAQGRVHANGEEKEDCTADPNPIHDPRVSCQPGGRQRGSRRQVHMFLGGAGLGLEVRFVRGSVVKCAGQRLRAGQTRNTASS